MFTRNRLRVKNRPTIHDIARTLKLTPATVSRALNNSTEISEKTKKIVTAEARRLNYKRNKLATSLRSGKTNVIGVIIPTAEHPFFGSVIHGISNLATSHGYDLLIYQSNELAENDQKGVQAFLSANVDGILASIAKNTTDFSHFLEIKKEKIPLVFFDRANDDLGIPSVVIDDFKGAYIATQHLIEQGYKTIAHISGPLNIQAFRKRFEGYKAALKKHKIRYDPQYLVEGNISIESGTLCTDKLLDLPKPPDAIFTSEDFTALGALKQLKNRGISVPEKFGLFGFCNELFTEYVTPSISSIDQKTVAMGEAAFRLIFELIRKTPRQKIEKQIILDPVPFFRESSQKKKK
jgi:LacI family transcriptional regulator